MSAADYRHLLAPGRIGGLELRNRIVLAPMGSFLAGADGHLTERHRRFYEERAKGGVPGNAVRGIPGSTAAGTSNLYVEPGTTTPEELIAGVEEGFYVTETLGFGVNLVSGEYSQGAAGIWIRDGRLDHAVQEVTVAGDLRSMLEGVDGVGNDLVLRAECSAPTIRISRMTVSGS